MARPAKLKLWSLLALVLVGHAAVLEWLARHREPVSVLQEMAPPMVTRLLRPEPPPPVVAPPPAPKKKPRQLPAIVEAPRPAASAPAVVAQAPQPPPPPPAVQPAPAADATAAAPAQPLAPEPLSQPVSAASQGNDAVASAAPPAASAPAATASAPLAVASAAQLPASAPDPLAGWPADTRLSYRLGGQFRNGELYGHARVLWQRDGARYQVRVDIDITLWAEMVLTSQGEVTPEGLMPRAYEELRPGRKRRGAEFGDRFLALENGKTAERPPGMQDTASQFVELAHRFATGREKLEVGGTVSFWMARPGAVDRWTYDVVEREMLRTPNLGEIEAFRLKPRPIANPRGNVTAEMWFAPSLQYLPVRIKVLMGENAYVDLMVEKIEQR